MQPTSGPRRARLLRPFPEVTSVSPGLSGHDRSESAPVLLLSRLPCALQDLLSTVYAQNTPTTRYSSVSGRFKHAPSLLPPDLSDGAVSSHCDSSTLSGTFETNTDQFTPLRLTGRTLGSFHRGRHHISARSAVWMVLWSRGGPSWAEELRVWAMTRHKVVDRLLQLSSGNMTRTLNVKPITVDLLL